MQFDNNNKIIDRKIRYIKLYNLRNRIVKFCLKLGIGIDKISPFIISILLCLEFGYLNKNMPFKKDIITSYVDNVDMNYDNFTRKMETDKENIIYSSLLSISSIIIGGNIYLLKHIYIKRSIGDILLEFVPLCIEYDKESLIELRNINSENINYLNDSKKRVLKMRQENER